MHRPLETLILTLRSQNVLLDADLAAIYGVPTKALNQAVKRNAARFPHDFLFQLSKAEKEEVVTNCDHLARLRFSPVRPYAFTEHGALMVANVLNSAQAVKMSVYVVRAFIKQRELLMGQVDVLKKLAQMDAKLLQHDDALLGHLARTPTPFETATGSSEAQDRLSPKVILPRNIPLPGAGEGRAGFAGDRICKIGSGGR